VVRAGNVEALTDPVWIIGSELVALFDAKIPRDIAMTAWGLCAMFFIIRIFASPSPSLEDNMFGSLAALTHRRHVVKSDRPI